MPPRLRALPAVFVFALLFTALFALHAPLLRLPYFWDEAGYFIPAARDVLLHSTLVARSIPSNAHPPLIPVYLATWWRLSGEAPAVTRTAMLLLAALALLAVFRLARRIANLQVALAAVACTALYPVFFSQSVLAHLDVAAAALCLWGLAFFIEARRAEAVLAFSLAVLAKETAVIVPVSIAAWELLWWVLRRRGRDSRLAPPPRHLAEPLLLLALPAATLGLWYAYHYWHTGAVFGNPEFVRYNVTATLHPVRLLLTALRRLWQLTGYMHLYLLTIPAALAMMFPPLRDPESTSAPAAGPHPAQPEGAPGERTRIAAWVQMVFAVVLAAHVLAFSWLGGAVLARYMLPVLPLVIILAVSTLRRRLRWWAGAVAVACAGFLLALLVNPPYRFSFEDNLAWRDYVLLHKQAADFLSNQRSGARVLTAWPANDELSKPYLRYVRQPFPVLRVDDFSAEVLAAADDGPAFDVVLMFSRKYEPMRRYRLVDWWERRQERYFDRVRDLPPEVWARQLGGQIVFQQRRGGQWVAVILIERAQLARR